jgi:hypothetical protein
MTENAFLAVAAIASAAAWTTVKITRAALSYRTTKRRDQAKTTRES